MGSMPLVDIELPFDAKLASSVAAIKCHWLAVVPVIQIQRKCMFKYACHNYSFGFSLILLKAQHDVWTLLINFRVLCFNNDHIHRLELFYERMLKLLLRERNQIQISPPYPRGVMGVMGLVMQTKTILSTQTCSPLSCYLCEAVDKMYQIHIHFTFFWMTNVSEWELNSLPPYHSTP